MSRRRLLLIVVIALLVVALIPLVYLLGTNSRPPAPSPITPTFGPVQGGNPLVETREILFMSNRDGDWDIYTMRLSDRSLTNLTSNDADDGFASYSADGGAITLLSNRDGALNPYMMDADGANVRPVANDLPTILSVLATGRLDWDYAEGWGQKTAFVSLRDLNLEIYARTADGDRNLTQNPAVDWYPAWSVSGDRIAFASDRDGNQEIYVMNADGSRVRRVTNAPGDDLYPMWRGNILYFMSDRDTPFANGQMGLYTVNPDAPAQPIRRVTSDLAIPFLDMQLWQPDGTQLFVETSGGDLDIFIADGVGRNRINLTDNDADDLFAVWRPQSS